MTWATSVPILVFLGLSCSRLRPDVRDRQTSDRRASSLNAPYPRGRGIINDAAPGGRCEELVRRRPMKLNKTDYGRNTYAHTTIDVKTCSMFFIC